MQQRNLQEYHFGGLSCDLHPVKHHYRQGSLQKANHSVLSTPIFF